MSILWQNFLYNRKGGNMAEKKNKNIKRGFDDSNFEKEIKKIRKIGEKIKKENIKIPDIPDFLKKDRKEAGENK